MVNRVFLVLLSIVSFTNMNFAQNTADSTLIKEECAGTQYLTGKMGHSFVYKCGLCFKYDAVKISASIGSVARYVTYDKVQFVVKFFNSSGEILGEQIFTLSTPLEPGQQVSFVEEMPMDNNLIKQISSRKWEFLKPTCQSMID